MRRIVVATTLLAVVALADDGATREIPNPSASDRIVVGEAIGGHGHLERLRYTQGEFGGELWLAHVDPKLATVSVEAAAKPSRLPRFVSATTTSAVAINGGFYSGSKPVGLVLAAGVAVAPASERGGSGVFFLDGTTARIVHRSEFVRTDTIDHALQSIDRLVDAGELLVNNREDLPHDARSVVAIDGAGQISFVVIFDQRAVASRAGGVTQLGPKSTTTGPTLFDIAELAVRPRTEGGLGARWVLNLDGGWSTSMVAWHDDVELELAPHKATINAVVARWR